MINPDADLIADALLSHAAVLLARKCSKDQLAAAVAALRDNGMAALAEVLIGPVPFTPFDETLARLTDE